MSFPIIERWNSEWEEVNIRCAVLLSLFLQLFLTLLAKSRKRRGNIVLIALLWSSYLIADWIAAFAVGLISSAQSSNCPERTALNKQLAAFWAPFLLLHLGGPDSITAFALEDNQLWIRHLLGLLIQLLAVVYVFLESLDNEYWIPIVLMSFAGTCKYVERTLALHQACLSNFKTALLQKPDPGPNYAQLMQEYSVVEASHVPVSIHIVREPEKSSAHIHNHDGGEIKELDDLDVVLYGYNFFNTFKGLIVDHMFSFHERNQSRIFFLKTSAIDAFKVMEVELNFMYDALYTKMPVVHCKLGYFSRLLCTTLIVLCFHQFATHHPQHNIIHFDKIVSYILLGGALVLDMVGMFNLVFSDWALISAKKSISALLFRLWFWKRKRRWSNTMSQLSFISFCFNQRSRNNWLKKPADFLRITDTLEELLCKKTIECKDELKQFIFKELKDKAKEAETRKKAKEIYSARGEWVLSKHYSDYLMYPSISSSLSEEVEYDESLLLWHVATELCYFTMSSDDDDENRKRSKVLSDYMLYLLVMRPTLMSTVAGIAQIRFQDSCKEFSKFFERWQSEPALDSKSACEELLKVQTVEKPKDVKGDRSKSLLFDACMLAKDLNKLNEGRKWEMMSRVWVELMSYAASHCRATDHARQLNQGGELITFVWLQMLHFGLGEQFRIEAGHARAKLLIGK